MRAREPQRVEKEGYRPTVEDEGKSTSDNFGIISHRSCTPAHYQWRCWEGPRGFRPPPRILNVVLPPWRLGQCQLKNVTKNIDSMLVFVVGPNFPPSNYRRAACKRFIEIEESDSSTFPMLIENQNDSFVQYSQNDHGKWIMNVELSYRPRSN